ncbi:MAG: dNTP triphosphohydrolase [Acidobacteria bacterium]|nr:dNTP triphosphohydrolase [Acidobacteriota bacterium]
MTRGRRFPELRHPYRNDFQRDRDRVIHTRAFRRLENKTQVFTPGLSDHFRNRLTHSIEVSQMARTVAQALGVDPDLTEALALVHDIGHPPFAHSGEEELGRQMARHGETFDHNLHALRIVENFEQRYARFPGLNLTFELREGIVKHSRDLTPGQNPDLDEYLPDLHPPIESQLIDLADEIAYSTADLDDAQQAGFFPLDDLGKAVPAWEDLYDTAQSMYPGAPPRVQFHEALRQMIDLLVTGFVDGTAAACRDAGVKTVEDVRRHPERLACLLPGARKTCLELKRFLRNRVYLSKALNTERERSVQMIAELFRYFESDPGRLPDLYQEQARTRPAHIVICEYIAGMTDGYCRRQYQELIADTMNK